MVLLHKMVSEITVDGISLEHDSAEVIVEQDSRGFKTWNVHLSGSKGLGRMMMDGVNVNLGMTCEDGTKLSGKALAIRLEQFQGNGELIGAGV